MARAVVPQSGIKPALPPQLGWSRIQERGTALYPPNGEASHQAKSLAPDAPIIVATALESGVEQGASQLLVPRRGTLTIKDLQGSPQISALSPAFESATPAVADSPIPLGFERPQAVSGDAQPEAIPPTPFGEKRAYERVTTQIVVDQRSPSAVDSERPSPTMQPRRPAARDSEPPVEVKIGRVEVSFDSPPQSAAMRPPAPRGFGDYTPLRRYSPQAWNRWRG